jgi:hypothetical protein
MYSPVLTYVPKHKCGRIETGYFGLKDCASPWYFFDMGHPIVRTLLCAGMLLASDLTLVAQDKTGFVLLEVEDVSGAVVANAQVQILPLPEMVGKNLTTDSGGKLLLHLASGTYHLAVKSPGLRPSTQRIDVKAGMHQTIAFVLNVQSYPPGSCTVDANVFPVSFPEQSQAVSPDGRYAVLGVDGDTKLSHTVLLEDRSFRTRRHCSTMSNALFSCGMQTVKCSQ